MAKIAMVLEAALAARAKTGAPGQLDTRLIASGDGWSVEDVVCTSDPRDRAFEEQHTCYRIVIVVAGSFQYRSEAGRELMTPGSVLLGNNGECFECGHDHSAGDRCLSFGLNPEFFERVLADIGVTPRTNPTAFRTPKLPPVSALSPAIASACRALTADVANAHRVLSWEELTLKLAAKTVQLAAGVSPSADLHNAQPSAVARVTKAVRLIDRDCSAPLTLETLAREARLSPYHFLRVFERLTGLTPHQYVRRMRLREAATRLAAEPNKIVDIALACGFEDISAFNRAFRSEFGTTPRAYRFAYSAGEIGMSQPDL